MKRYGLVENANKDKNEIDPSALRRYKDPVVEEPEPYRPSSSSSQNGGGHFDHHAEIARAKKDMADQEKAQRLDELADDEENGRTRPASDIQEFDSLSIDKKIQGELIVRNNKYLSRDDEAIDLAQINVREASDTILIFRRIPFAIWVAGFLIQICGLYLIYHLALGHYGVLFKGYREGHWWQYLISILMLIFGIIFMYAGKVESIIFDK